MRPDRSPSTLSSALAAAVALLLVLAAAVPAAGQVFYLSGKDMVPPRDTRATGQCLVYHDELGGSDAYLLVSCTHDVADPIAARIHLGGPGENGPALFELNDPDGNFLTWYLDLPDLTDQTRLLLGDLYLQIASTDHTGGEIRGQIRNLMWPPDVFHYRFPLSGDQMVPPVSSGHSGQCVAMYGASRFDQTVDVLLGCVHDVAEATGAAIHLAEEGSAGPEIIDLGDGRSPIVWYESWPAGTPGPYPDLIRRAMEERLALQIRSTGHPGGELRGQMTGCVITPLSQCLQRDRFQVEVTWNDPFGNSGDGQALPLTADSALFWFFNPNNQEMLVKVLNGCAVNDHYWVFAAATTNVAFDLRVQDRKRDVEMHYTNPLGNPAAPILDTQAFATCP